MSPKPAPERSYPRAAAILLAAIAVLAAAAPVGVAAEESDAAAILRAAWEPLYRLDPGVGFDAAVSYRATTTYRGMVVNGKRESTVVAGGKIAYRGPGRIRIDSTAPVPAELHTLLLEVMARYETRLFDAEFDAELLTASSDGERTLVRSQGGGSIDFAYTMRGGVREWIAVKDGLISAAQVRFPGPPVPADVLFDFTTAGLADGRQLLARSSARWRTSQHFERDVAVTPEIVDGVPLPGVVEIRESAFNLDPDVKTALSKGGSIGRETSARLEFRDVKVLRNLGPPDLATGAGSVLSAAWGRLARVPDAGGILRARVRADVAPGIEGAPTRVRVEGMIRAAFAPGGAGSPPIVSLDGKPDRRCPASAAPHALARATALARTALAAAAPATYAREFAGVEARLVAEHPAVRITTAPYSAAGIEMPSRDGGSIRFISDAGGVIREIHWRSEGDVRLPTRIVSETGVEIIDWAKTPEGVYLPTRYRTVPPNDGFREDVRFEDARFE